MAENINSLLEKSNSIGAILNTIMGISQQTNLLALNAAIEAARAGEAGKGFTVVAEEIRTLSEETGHATKDIEDILISIEAIEKLRQGLNKVNGDKEDAILAIQNISSITEETAASTEELSASMEEQAATIETISSNADNLNQTIKELKELVNKFKI